MGYEHSQYGYFGAGTVILMVVVAIITLPETFAESTLLGWGVTAMLVAIAALLVWFSRLVVRVDQGELSASFGPGRPRRVIDLADVATAAPVRNTWIQGWGIRRISGGWMYNVWGLDAVEFAMTSGEIARIGTNDMENLLASVHVYTG
jgi:hypothetical protein